MSIPQNWRIRQQRYALVGEVCQNCHSKVFPPREVCPVCGAPVHVQLAFLDSTDLLLVRRLSETPHEAACVPVQRG